MAATIDQIWCYPVKSLAGQSLARVDVTAAGLPGDRQFALAHGAGDFDPQTPAWRPKGNFVNLVRTSELARLVPAYAPDSGRLTIAQGDQVIASGRPADAGERADMERALTNWLGDAARGQVRLAWGEGVAFTDVPAPLISIINLASVRQLAERAGLSLDARRFRGNLVIDGLRPWGEFDWPGRQVQVGGAVVKIVERITRCAATHVNPETAARDADVVGTLERALGHVDMGVYAEIVSPGRIVTGDILELI
jgi:uncharacterized protein YcbX